MRFAYLLATALAVSCTPGVQAIVQAPNDPGNMAVTVALAHTMLMTEGCSAVDVGHGLIVTAKHCTEKMTLGAVTSVGVLVFQSPVRDFAVFLDVTKVMNLRPVLRAPHLGEHLYAVGYPQQIASDKQELTVTDGVFAGPVDDVGSIRFTAPIYFGNSGGGVWSDNGELLGISVSGYLEMPGMNYMVNAADVLPALNQ